MITEVKVGQIWKHKKRGSFYKVTKLETFQTAICEELDNSTVVSYCDINGEPYAREISEFTDGRFEFVKHRSTVDQVFYVAKLVITVLTLLIVIYSLFLR